MMEYCTTKEIQRFEQQIEEFENQLFGVLMYHQSAPRLFRWMQWLSFRNIMRRSTVSINLAKHLLSEVKAGCKPESDLQHFPWPPWTSDMTNRIDILLSVYAKTFPHRAKTKLSGVEARILRESLLRYMTISK